MTLAKLKEDFINNRSETVQLSGGLDSCLKITQSVDRIIIRILEIAELELDVSAEFALVATGGHGRRELAPFSDIDIAVLLTEEINPKQDLLLRRLFKDLNRVFTDELKVSLDYGLRSSSDVIGLDGITRTSLLDARFLAGSYGAFDQYFAKYWKQFPIADFLLDRIDERKKQKVQTHTSPFSSTPNIKIGAGGLRSFHAANWIRLPLGYQQLATSEEYQWLIGVRNLLHQLAGQKKDTLSPFYQDALAKACSLPLADFMSKIFKSMESIEACYTESLDLVLESKFEIRPGVRAKLGLVEIQPNSSAGSVAMGLALAQELGIKTQHQFVPYEVNQDGESLLKALSLSLDSFDTMVQSGLVDRVLPDLANTKYSLQPGTGHDWTVYEHTIRVAQNLINLSDDEGWKGQIYRQAGFQSELILISLLHDIAKPIDLENHSKIGATRAKEITKEWNLEPFSQDLICWVIEHHLDMSKVIRFRDVHLPATSENFAQSIPSVKHLACLTLMTFADMSAVNKETYTAVTDSFLQELYVQTAKHLTPDSEESEIQISAVQTTDPPESLTNETRKRLEILLDQLPASYLVSTKTEQALTHLSMHEKVVQTGQPQFNFERKLETGTTELSVCSYDKPGLLSQILGALYAYDISIISLKASTTTEEKPIAIDVFTVSYDGKPVPPATTKHLILKLLSVINNELLVHDLLLQKGKDPNRTEQNFSYEFHSGSPAIVDFKAKRGRGLAFRFSQKLSALGWNIVGARVSQWGAMGAASFYVEGPKSADEVEQAFGPKVH